MPSVFPLLFTFVFIAFESGHVTYMKLTTPIQQAWVSHADATTPHSLSYCLPSDLVVIFVVAVVPWCDI